MIHTATRLILPAVLAAWVWPAPLSAAQAAKWPSSSAPRPLAARDVAFPPYQVRSLSNGLRLVVVRHTEQPAVSLRLIVGAGPAQDPPGTPGVAAMVSSLLDQGTTTLGARQIADTIDGVGGELETGVGRDLSFAHAVVMKDSLPLAMDLLADIVRHPVFAGEELERQRRQTLSALQVSYQDPEYLANIVFDRLVYGSDPYGFPGNGTPESVPRITRDDLVAFHRDYYAPNNCLLAVVGDVTVEEAAEAAARAFGDWARHEVATPTPPGPPQPARRLVILDKPDAVQTEIRVGQLGIPRNSSDHMPVDLAIKILGGEGANRLHRVLRTERGLTYGASADTETLKRSGEFVAQTNTRSEATGEVLRLIVDEYSRLRREPVGDKELADAKAYLTGHFPMTIETPDDIATQVLNALFYGLPLEELQTYRQRVNAVSADDVSRVAGKYLKPDRLAVVLVGNASAFLDQLRGVGFGKFEVVRLSDLDLGAATFRKAEPARSSSTTAATAGGAAWPRGIALPVGYARLSAAGGLAPAQASSSAVQAGQAAQPPAPAPAGPTTAEALIRRAIEAKGGLEALKAVRTVVATTSTTVNLPQGPARTQTTTYIEYPDHFRVEAQLPQGMAVQVYAGENDVWAQEPGKPPFEPPPLVRRDFKASVERDLIPLLVDAAAGKLSVRLADAAPGRPGDTVRVVEVSGAGREPVRLFIDTVSGLVVRESYSAPGGGSADELFSDYRPVAGIMIAFKAAVRRDNAVVLERVVTGFQINTALPAGVFVRGAAAAQPPGPPSSRPSPLSSPSSRPGPSTIAPPADPTTAEALIRRAVEAKGGLEALKAVRTLVATALTTIDMPQGPVRAQTRTYIEYPDHFRVEAQLPQGMAVQVYAGENDVWAQLTGQPPSELRSPMKKSIEAAVKGDLIALLVDAASGRLTVRLADYVPGGPADTVRAVEVSGRGREPVRLFIDTVSGLVVRESYSVAGGGDVDDLFSDYRPVAGVMIPFRVTVRHDKAQSVEVVTDVKINVALPAGLFARGGAAAADPPRPSSSRLTPAAPASPPASQTPPPATAPPSISTPSPGARLPGPAAPLPSPAKANESDKAALALIDRAIAAKGGLARLKALKTWRIDGKNTEYDDSHRTDESQTTSYFQYPDKYRIENRSHRVTAIAILSGNSLELRVPGSGTTSVPIASQSGVIFKASVERDPASLLLRIAAGELQAQLFGPTVSPGEPRPQLIQVTGSAEFQPVVLGIDLASGMVTRESYAMPPGGDGPWVDEVFSDFRDVDGIKVPFRSTTTRMNTVLRERQVERVQVNPELDPRVFALPR